MRRKKSLRKTNRKSLRKTLRKLRNNIERTIHKSIKKTNRKPLRRTRRKVLRKTLRKPNRTARKTLRKTLRKTSRKTSRKTLRKTSRKTLRKIKNKTLRKTIRKNIRNTLRKTFKKKNRRTLKKILKGGISYDLSEFRSRPPNRRIYGKHFECEGLFQLSGKVNSISGLNYEDEIPGLKMDERVTSIRIEKDYPDKNIGDIVNDKLSKYEGNYLVGQKSDNFNNIFKDTLGEYLSVSIYDTVREDDEPDEPDESEEPVDAAEPAATEPAPDESEELVAAAEPVQGDKADILKVKKNSGKPRDAGENDMSFQCFWISISDWFKIKDRRIKSKDGTEKDPTVTELREQCEAIDVLNHLPNFPLDLEVSEENLRPLVDFANRNEIRIRIFSYNYENDELMLGDCKRGFHVCDRIMDIGGDNRVDADNSILLISFGNLIFLLNKFIFKGV